MKLAPSRENVDLLRQVASGLHNISDTSVQEAAAFVTKAQASRDGLTDGDAEGLDDVLQYVRGDTQKMSDMAMELATEASQLADELDQHIPRKTLKI